jgi:hypothetical protein
MFHTHLSNKKQFFSVPFNPADISFDTIINHLISSILATREEIETFLRDWERMSTVREKHTRALLGVSLDSLGSELKLQIASYQDSLLRAKILSDLSWRKLWDKFSEERGPWFVPGSVNFTRDCCACFAGFPGKFARAHHYSFRLDFGDPQAKLLLEFHCEIITTKKSHESTFELFEDRIVLTSDESRRFGIPLKEIQSIHVRNPHRVYFLSITGSNVLIQLQESSLFALLSVLGKCQAKRQLIDTLDPMKAFRSRRLEMGRWINSKVSNFEYLLLLNSLSRRDFHDLENYPLFPWLTAGRRLNHTVDGRPTCRRCPMSQAVATKFHLSTFSGDVNQIMQECQEQGLEAVPDIYAVPEFSSLEYVYGLRKVLESTFVSSELNLWISLIWSSDFDSMIRPLFAGTHPKRKTEPPRTDSIETVNVSQSIDHAIVTRKGPSFVVRFLFERTVADVTFQGDVKKPPTQTPGEVVNMPAAHGDWVFTQYQSTFLFFSVGSPLFYLVDGLSALPLNPHIGDIRAVACVGRWLVAAGHDSSVTLFLDLKRYWEIFLYRARPVCLSLSDTFKVVAAGMADMSIVLCSLVSGQVVHVADIRPLMPKRVIVTPAWGFVVVYAEEVVFEQKLSWAVIFTVNGRQFRKFELPFPVDNWCTWKSRQGFDYMALADKAGNLYVAEVYFVESLECVYKADSRLVKIAFLEEIEAIIAISEAGRITIVPFVCNA